MVNYLLSWLGCAKQHGLTIDYLGGWNERGYNVGWYEQLRSALNSNGYCAVKIVGADSDWTIANDVDSNPQFASAVDILGAHYPCGYRSSQSNCSVPSAATSSGKQLWASENGSDDYNAGAQAMARGINRGYIDGKMTAYLNWPIVAAITPNLPYPTMGVALAPQPWSGSYSVGKNAWVMAQTTQFTAPGWKYLDSSSGYIGGNRNNGSYVSLKSTNNSDYSTVIETHGRRQRPDAELQRHRRPVHRRGARLVDQRQLQQLGRLLRARLRHHPERRQLQPDRAARLRLHPHHHDRPGQGHRDQPRAGRVGPALQRLLRRQRHRHRSQVPDGLAGLLRGRRPAAAAAPASACAR